MDGGLHTRPFLAEKEIITESIPYNDTPYYYGVRYKPLSFKLQLSTLDDSPWTFEKRREIARWLDTSEFEEFYLASNPSQIYYINYQGGIDLTYNGQLFGYLDVEFLNLSPYSHSPIYSHSNDLSDITTPTIVEFINNGDLPVTPEMQILKIGDGDLSIKNTSDGGIDFKFSALKNNETIYIDNDLRHISTDIPNTYRLDNFNGNYLSMPRGVNRLEVSGKCEILWRYKFQFKG